MKEEDQTHHREGKKQKETEVEEHIQLRHSHKLNLERINIEQLQKLGHVGFPLLEQKSCPSSIFKGSTYATLMSLATTNLLRLVFASIF
jgi:hypothetical protein